METLQQSTEVEIIERILEGETDFYEILVRRLNPCLYKVGRSYNYNHEDTQDLMQETFLDAYKNLSLFQGRSSFQTWIIRIMMNNCFRKKQKSSYRNETTQVVADNSKPMFTAPHKDAGKIIQNRELEHIIEDALARLPLSYRMVFSLREVTGLNVSETASLLHITEANVKVRLNRAKTMLRGEIEKTYSDTELFEFNLKYCNGIVEDVMRKIREL